MFFPEKYRRALNFICSLDIMKLEINVILVYCIFFFPFGPGRGYKNRVTVWSLLVVGDQMVQGSCVGGPLPVFLFALLYFPVCYSSPVFYFILIWSSMSASTAVGGVGGFILYLFYSLFLLNLSFFLSCLPTWRWWADSKLAGVGWHIISKQTFMWNILDKNMNFSSLY